MSDTKWTPGPWDLSRYHHPYRDIVVRTGDKDNDARPAGRLICTVASKKEQKANAHLIAAAPDLYEALEPFAAFACSPPGECQCNNCIARAALAKARGQS